MITFFSYVKGTRPKVAAVAAIQTGLKGLFYMIRVNSYKLTDLEIIYYFVSFLSTVDLGFFFIQHIGTKLDSAADFNYICPYRLVFSFLV